MPGPPGTPPIPPPPAREAPSCSSAATSTRTGRSCAGSSLSPIRTETGPRRARIALVTAAAAPAETAEEAQDPEQNNAAANGLYYARLFQRYGATTYAVPVDTTQDAFAGDAYGPRAARDRRVARQVERSTGVFFGGGDQMDYVRTLMTCRDARREAFRACSPSPVLEAVARVLDKGGVVAGVSAGTTIQQGPDMVTGGEPYEAWRDGATAGYLEDPDRLGYLPFGGFGFFAGALLDSHFGTWGRQARMVRLAEETGHRRVVGIDETTALVVDRASARARVIGENGVSILDVRGRGASWTYLAAGDRIDLRTWEVRPGRAAHRITGSGPAPAPIEDAWDSAAADDPGSYSLVDLAVALVRSSGVRATGTTLETGPRYRTTLVRTEVTRAWGGSGRTSFSGLRLRIGRAG